MSLHLDGPRAGHYIADEVSVELSRRVGVIASGSGVVKAGTVLAIDSTSGEFVPLNPGGSNDTDKAVGILYETVDATSGDETCVVSVALTAVNDAELTWPTGISDEDKATAIAELRALDIAVLAGDSYISGS